MFRFCCFHTRYQLDYCWICGHHHSEADQCCGKLYDSSFSSQLLNFQFFDNVTIPMPVSANYRRIVEMTYGVKEEQIYRVCTGKNKKTCGFWENVQTKAKVESGKTTYNKNKKALIIKKIMKTDFGLYMTGNKKYEQKVNSLFLRGR
ncbi:hypothetical protein CRE_08939 [Caenorhabditis remanei]|uniref:Uncharacterized protein n=1 Tax=Caenorhabditis remanei TaxID=31234 RepID=E3LID4_CAERE|nr:hypothetical protein CRE_08939 [Caenorhabditis remanei]